jgi:LmbE family N-acetylglucosaminyl deacetylase
MTVLCVAAHPDDEVLGAGGTLALHHFEGQRVCVLFLTNGTGSRPSNDIGAVRLEMARKSCVALGAEMLQPGTFRDQRLDGENILDVTQFIEAHIRDVRPDTIYTHHFGDRNKDHRVVHDAVMTACRPMSSTVRRIYGFEVPSSTEWGHGFVPTRFVDISTAMGIKRKALEAYGSEMRDFPHPRSYQAIDALAQWRGASAGLTAAEAFMVLREIA